MEIVKNFFECASIIKPHIFIKDDPEKDKPSVFSIFILSHGDINGKIDTDHVIKTQTGEFIFDSYNKDDIWYGLEGLEMLRDCLKLVFLAVRMSITFCDFRLF